MNMESKNNKKEVKENNQQIKLSKKQIEAENRLLRNIFIFVGILFFLFLASYVIMGSIRNFNYRGTDFEVTKEGEDLVFYRTSFPLYSPDGEWKMCSPDYERVRVNRDALVLTDETGGKDE